mmetsp:Transcript_27096/g.76252  ORF Transcript_27096/g.76252 Transcript_27096/m.76252 type:complete len:329 (+) Transcript_27096:64-1050(+)
MQSLLCRRFVAHKCITAHHPRHHVTLLPSCRLVATLVANPANPRRGDDTNRSTRRLFSVKELPWCTPKQSGKMAEATIADSSRKESANMDDHVRGAPDPIERQSPDGNPRSNNDLAEEPISAFGIVAAMSKNRIIGINGGIPWRVPKDRAIFKSLTKDSILIMGRGTFEERPQQDHIDHAARCIVISSTLTDDQLVEKSATKLELADSMDVALARARQHDIIFNEDPGSTILNNDDDAKSERLRCWVVGGERIYEEALKHKSATEVHLSTIDLEVEVDADTAKTVAMFPGKYRWDHRFNECSSEAHAADGSVPGFTYRVYRAKSRRRK